MSAYISAVATEGAVIFTDGAIYDQALRLVAVQQKVWTAQRAPLAVAARGDWSAAASIATATCAAADSQGADAVIEELQDVADQLRDQAGGDLNGQGAVQVLVAAFLPGGGGTHRSFSTRPHRSARGEWIEAWEVYEPGPAVFAGPRIDKSEIESAGIPLKEASESVAGYIARVGVGFMELMRGKPENWSDPTHLGYVIGGHVDRTVIDAAGCRTETVRVWDDIIGEPIDPFAGMNRAERRRLARAA